jgi:hypothetical protein
MKQTPRRATPRRRDAEYVVVSFSIPRDWRATLRRKCAQSHMTFSRVVCDALRPMIMEAQAK